MFYRLCSTLASTGMRYFLEVTDFFHDNAFRAFDFLGRLLGHFWCTGEVIDSGHKIDWYCTVEFAT